MNISNDMIKAGYLEVLRLVSGFLAYVDQIGSRDGYDYESYIELVPNDEINKMMKSPLSVSFMNLCGFEAPLNEDKDHWKVCLKNHQNVIKIINESMNTSN